MSLRGWLRAARAGALAPGFQSVGQPGDLSTCCGTWHLCSWLITYYIVGWLEKGIEGLFGGLSQHVLVTCLLVRGTDTLAPCPIAHWHRAPGT